MLGKTSTATIVSNLLDKRAMRINKIKNASSSAEDKIKELNIKMTELLNTFVELDLQGETEKKNIIDKSIKELRLEIEEWNNKKEAYQRVSIEDKSLIDDLNDAIESAREENIERIKALQKKIEERDSLCMRIKKLEEELKGLDREVEGLKVEKQAKQLLPLLKYIEPRKIKFMRDVTYLQALISGEPKEILEQYIEPVVNGLESKPENILKYTVNH